MTVVGNETAICRICYERSPVAGSLSRPCRCSGTMAHVHQSCLEPWLEKVSRDTCDICSYRFRWDVHGSLLPWSQSKPSKVTILIDVIFLVLGFVAMLATTTYQIVSLDLTKSWSGIVYLTTSTCCLIGYLDIQFIAVLRRDLAVFRSWHKHPRRLRSLPAQ
ncbi:hypothetical protein HPB47_000031 [Ixodes persulcatus]|uniref:Uncharacterized protein n=1 Tax=Ixodes persulcatus TaxID=34615 RepID=A0AC60PTC9_IXOPE|nr:hypothetical protein HPB47_000031 [Ixodes persulcatus]